MANNSYEPAVGYLGKVRITDSDDFDVLLCANHWVFDEEVAALDVTSFCSGGYREYLGGLADATFEFSGIWDFAFNPFSGPPAMKIGATVTVEFFIDRDGHPTLAARCGQALVQHWHVEDGADGTCNYTCTLNGNWDFQDFANTDARFVPE